jgi:hypothetical protein
MDQQKNFDGNPPIGYFVAGILGKPLANAKLESGRF